MRDFLEDAEAHRKDGYRAAQGHARQELPKKFYAAVDVARMEDGFAVTLDGRPVRTPGMKPVRVPTLELARALAAEWERQAEVIDVPAMPLVRLVNSAVELGGEGAAGLRDEIVKYAANDLLLYRADTPRELAAAQEAAWDPVLVALARHFGVKFQPTVGIIHQPQPEPTLARLRDGLGGETHFALAALASATSITGSALLAIAWRLGLATAEDVWAAAHVDEDHNMRLWGEDAEATARRAFRRAEFDAALLMLEKLAEA